MRVLVKFLTFEEKVRKSAVSIFNTGLLKLFRYLSIIWDVLIIEVIMLDSVPLDAILNPNFSARNLPMSYVKEIIPVWGLLTN